MPLQRLYLVRFVFALVWAAALFVAGPAVATVLLVLYPLADVAAAVLDARTNGASMLLVANMVMSLLAAGGLAVAATSGTPATLRVWGAWAIAAGLIQLVVGLGRRRLGGQWAMIVSGAGSVLAGTGFVLQASGPDASLNSLAGYAVVGGILFGVSAWRMSRTAPQYTTAKGI